MVARSAARTRPAPAATSHSARRSTSRADTRSRTASSGFDTRAGSTLAGQKSGAACDTETDLYVLIRREKSGTVVEHLAICCPGCGWHAAANQLDKERLQLLERWFDYCMALNDNGAWRGRTALLCHRSCAAERTGHCTRRRNREDRRGAIPRTQGRLQGERARPRARHRPQPGTDGRRADVPRPDDVMRLRGLPEQEAAAPRSHGVRRPLAQARRKPGIRRDRG